MPRPNRRRPVPRNVFYSEAEDETLRALAERHNLSVSEWIRRTSLADDSDVAALRREVAEMRETLDTLMRLRDHATIARLPQPSSVPDDWEGQSDYEHKHD